MIAKGYKRTFGGEEMFHTLIVAVVTYMCISVKTHSTVYLK